jgi:hypothetical protein
VTKLKNLLIIVLQAFEYHHLEEFQVCRKIAGVDECQGWVDECQGWV